MRPILILFQQFKYPLFSASIWSAIANRISGEEDYGLVEAAVRILPALMYIAPDR